MSSQHALNRAREICDARIARGLASHGVADDGTLRPIPGSIEGTLLVYRMRSFDGVETCEPDYLGVLDDEPWISDTDLSTLDRHIARHARRVLRRSAIDRGPPHMGVGDPRWSHTMHRLALATLREARLDPAILIQDTWEEQWRGGVEAFAASRGVAIAGHHDEDGRIDIRSIFWEGVEMHGEGRPRIVVDRAMPETLAAALAGRLLADVVSHPAITRAGPIRIVEAQPVPGFTVIILEDVHDFIRRPPPGTDRRWARIPFMPTADIEIRTR